VGQVREYQGYFVLAEQIGEAGIEPGLVANLDGKFVIGREFLEEWREQREERFLRGEFPAIKEWELKDDRTELISQDVHSGEELRQFGVTVDQHLFMGDDLRNFDGEQETVGSPGRPVLDSSRGRAAVEGGIHFDGMKMLRIKSQIVGGPHSLGKKVPSQPAAVKEEVPRRMGGGLTPRV